MKKLTLVLAVLALVALGTGVALAATMTGTNGDDTLIGTTGTDTIKGLAGEDEIWGRQGSDERQGGADDDKMYGDGSCQPGMRSKDYCSDGGAEGDDDQGSDAMDSGWGDDNAW